VIPDQLAQQSASLGNLFRRGGFFKEFAKHLWLKRIQYEVNEHLVDERLEDEVGRGGALRNIRSGSE